MNDEEKKDEDKKKEELKHKKEEEEAKKKIDKEFGFVPANLMKDSYTENILWILKKYDLDFDSEGKIHFKLWQIMEKFGAEDIDDKSFRSTQSTKIDKINRNNKYPGYSLSCGLDGEDKDGDRLWYYKRAPKTGEGVEDFSKKFGDDIRTAKEEKDESNGEETESVEFGGVQVESGSLKEKSKETD